jgi:hypothetical protein
VRPCPTPQYPVQGYPSRIKSGVSEIQKFRKPNELKQKPLLGLSLIHCSDLEMGAGATTSLHNNSGQAMGRCACCIDVHHLSAPVCCL